MKVKKLEVYGMQTKKNIIFQLCLSRLGKERVDEIFDLEIAVNRAINYYRNQGYTDQWIKARLTGILDRKKFTSGE
ncbi:MAG: hypothetical protein PHX04_04525 [Bacilli bacterium]|nr:hypothetical protein [Bacilli bacterium]